MLNLLTNDVRSIIVPDLNSKILYIFIGNVLRSDDGVGPYLYSQLEDLPNNLFLINAEDKPENVFDSAIRISPDKTVIFDAADFQGVPGEIRIIQQKFISEVILSTHTFPVSVLSRLIAEDTNSRVHFIGIQPENVNYGENITKEVKNSANEIAKFINEEAKKCTKCT
jgi:hydrogenase 3 maturation protease